MQQPPILSTEQIVAAEGARYLLENPIFTGCMDEIVRDATEKAIILDDPGEREASRQLVLAVGRIRGSLEAAVDYVASAQAEEQRSKSFE